MKGLLKSFPVFVLVGFFTFSGITNDVARAQDSHLEKQKKEAVIKFMEDHPELNSKFFDLISSMDILSQTYVDKKSFEEYLNLAIKGMAEGLDSYSDVLIGGEYESLLNSTKEQTRAGIGITIVKFGKEVYVASVVSGSPAERAGLEQGNMIVKADGKKLYGLSLEEASGLIRGPENEAVVLEVRSIHHQKPQVITIVRKNITYPSVESKQLSHKIGYIKISSFGTETPERVRGMLRAMSGNRGLIIDLRGNPGGRLDSLADILGYFIGARQPIIIQRDRNGDFSVETKTNKENYPTKVVVLIDNFSASASEIMAGNLKYYKVANLIGVRTFGKALVQGFFDIDSSKHEQDKSKLMVKVTVARYLLPGGEDIQDVGVEPDTEVLQAENFRIYNRGTQKDIQFQRALKFFISKHR